MSIGQDEARSAEDRELTRAYPPAVPVAGAALWLLIRDGAVLVGGDDSEAHLLISEQDPRGPDTGRAPMYLGTLGGVPCLADDLAPDDAEPAGTHVAPLRSLYAGLSAAEFALAGYASQMLYWRRTSGFCPVCGHATEPRPGDWGRLCPHCGHIAYPHVTPAVLILVHDGAGRILLAHKPGWGPRYSILAGFVEPGESLEDCVRRESKEEAGIDVADLEYAGSQPWPYPHQLMVGFRARCCGGEMRPDAEELDDARWFTARDLPDLPPPVSLSRQMIDDWIAEQRRDIAE